ncbi:hypothetical protein HHK36_014616 [Tetracentron sinense]|uniref:Uncharacterized protein n=1 Tax=Tetracentron sinense TaxID=13715 RepID=A0A835DCV8_TETSI|nr:hypothetical protein HHK36_014616 [Tetracentron sinense]
MVRTKNASEEPSPKRRKSSKGKAVASSFVPVQALSFLNEKSEKRYREIFNKLTVVYGKFLDPAFFTLWGLEHITEHFKALDWLTFLTSSEPMYPELVNLFYTHFDMRDMPGIMSEMPPMPVSINEELASSILPNTSQMEMLEKWCFHYYHEWRKIYAACGRLGAVMGIQRLVIDQRKKPKDAIQNLLLVLLHNLSDDDLIVESRGNTLADLGEQLKNSNTTRFATAQRVRASDPVYAMAQCRDYLSTADCLTCFAAAEYESSSFFDQGTLPGNAPICGNRTTSQTSGFSAAVGGLLADLLVATPRIVSLFAAATKREGGGAAVYGVAQCALTLSKATCEECLSVAYGNIQSCPPNADGRAVDAGCFMRYSDTSFFSDNQTTNLIPFLRKGGSSKKKAIIAGVVGGVGVVLFLVLIFLYLRQRRKPKKAAKGSCQRSGKEGLLKNEKLVAVKKLTIGQSSKAKADFESEVKLISNVHHRNLIRLLGCCSKGPELLLVYEYMAKSSLDKFLFGKIHLYYDFTIGVF